MISERQIANGFQGLWSELLPLLTPQFVRLFNEAYVKRVVSLGGQASCGVPSGQESDAALVAEIAYRLASTAHKEGIAVEEIDSSKVDTVKADAIAKINQLVGGTTPFATVVSSSESIEAGAIAGIYGLFLQGKNPDSIEYAPAFRGSGFIDACLGDLTVGNCLYEVKTVERNIAGKDLRQLLVYLALRHAAGESPWKIAGFFNPRRAVEYSFEVDRMIPLLSGGKVSSEVFRDMVEAFGMRDVQLDHAF